ncbi:hypothetical protein [Lysobacter gummosus]|uniref:hypothetical protein n=1 Tax=Lysobacter gummosus TaxID=262324 RepID=UPI00362ED9B0
MSLVAALIFLVPAGVLLLVRGVRLYRYELGDRAFSVSLFGRYEIVSIRYEEMAEVTVAKWWELNSAGWWPLLLKDRFASEVVVIERRGGLQRCVVVTPERPQEFVARIAMRRLEIKRTQSSKSI